MTQYKAIKKTSSVCVCALLFITFCRLLLANQIDGWLFVVPEILDAFSNATQCATKWAKAWHKWALFNTAVMSHYTLRSYRNVASQFVVAAVTGYFHSISCAAHSKGVDDSLQVGSSRSM